MAIDPYLDYLGRFEEHVGPMAVGSYGKYHGRLVRKLGAEEFTQKYGEYSRLSDHYRAMLERGDTLNDALTKILRERRDELLLEDDLPVP
jgi:hypothetical protein